MTKQDSTQAPTALREAISNLVVRVYADHVGRGPTKARAYVDRDMVICTLEDTMTRAERTLVESDRASAVLGVRQSFHETMRVDLETGMEALVERRVRALITGTQLKPDITTQVFVLDGTIKAKTPCPLSR